LFFKKLLIFSLQKQKIMPTPMTDAQILSTLETSGAIKITGGQPAWQVNYKQLGFLQAEMEQVTTEAPRVITGVIKVYNLAPNDPPANVPVKIYLGNILSTSTNIPPVTVNEAATNAHIIIVKACSAFFEGEGRGITATIGSENLFVAFSGEGYPVHFSNLVESLDGSVGGDITVTAGNGNDIHAIAGKGGVGSAGYSRTGFLCNVLPVRGGNGRDGGNGGNVTVNAADGNYMYLRAGNGGDGGFAGRSCAAPRLFWFIPVTIPASGFGGAGGNGGNITVNTTGPNNRVDRVVSAGGTGGTAVGAARAGANGAVGVNS
jgi:hypothetical protein